MIEIGAHVLVHWHGEPDQPVWPATVTVRGRNRAGEMLYEIRVAGQRGPLRGRRGVPPARPPGLDGARLARAGGRA